MNPFPDVPMSIPLLHIGDRPVGPGHPCLIVAEVAQAHDGSLGLAHAYIDAAALAGADAVKFQTHIAAEESTPDEPFRVPNPQFPTRYDYWKRMEFTPEQWHGLRDHARDRGLLFLSSPFSLRAVEILEPCVAAWKLGSGEIRHHDLIRAAARTGRAVLVSTGMAQWSEIAEAVQVVRTAGAAVAVLQCTSRYPTPPEEVGPQVIRELRERFSCVTGLSDHSGTIFPAIVAPLFGASIIEIHLTMSREMYGPDVPASVTTQELREVTRGVRFVEAMIDGAPDKDRLAADLAATRRLFFRSIAARRDIAAETIIAAPDLALRKPGTGLPPEMLPTIIGARARRRIPAGSLLQADDFLPSQSQTRAPHHLPVATAAAPISRENLS